MWLWKVTKATYLSFHQQNGIKALSNAFLGLLEGDNKPHTGHSSTKCPVQGIIIFKGSQFLSTRVTLRHYMFLKRLLDQQRISTDTVAASGSEWQQPE